MKVPNPTTTTTAALVDLARAVENAARVVRSDRQELRQSACDKLADAAIDLHTQLQVLNQHRGQVSKATKSSVQRDLAIVFGQLNLTREQLDLAVGVVRELGEALGVAVGPNVTYFVKASDQLGDELLSRLGYGRYVTVSLFDGATDAFVINWNATPQYGQDDTFVPFTYYSRQAAWADVDSRAENDWSDLDAAAAERAADPHGVFL